MEPWILDKIKKQKQAKERESRVQPRIPVSPPEWHLPEIEDKNDSNDTNIDFEIKF